MNFDPRPVEFDVIRPDLWKPPYIVEVYVKYSIHSTLVIEDAPMTLEKGVEFRVYISRNVPLIKRSWCWGLMSITLFTSSINQWIDIVDMVILRWIEFGDFIVKRILKTTKPLGFWSAADDGHWPWRFGG